MRKYNDDTITGTCLKNAQQYPDKVYILSRYDKQGRRTDQVHSYTWAEADRIVRDLSLGLMSLGFKEFERCAVFAPNRPRWIFSAMAPMFLRGIMVTIYPTSKEEDVWWILYDSGAKFCFCSGKEQLEKVLKVKERVETLEKVFVMDPLEERPDDIVMGFDELVELGKKHRDKEEKLEEIASSVQPEDLCTIIYTSGTTGRPKGVMLSHSNIVSQRILIKEFDFTQDDIWMAHLPFCHSYGFSADLMAAGYIPGILGIVDSLQTEEIRWGLTTFRPTVMNSVPRLWEKLYIQINSTLAQAPAFLRNYFNWGIELGSKIYLLENEKKPVPAFLRLKYSLAKPLFNMVKKKAGLDRLRLCSTGGGPINPDLIVYFGAMGIKLYQGYGLTETSPIINANTPRANKLGTVGKPLPGVEERIDEDGEILVKGPQVMKGYWNNEEATKEVFTPDGFFRTGDIGFIDEESYLTITDRKKELIITSGGKNIPPQPIENEFNTDPYIEQVAVVGDGRKYISALIVPEFEALSRWAKEQGIEFKDYTELVRHPKVVELVQQRVDLVNQRLAKYEQIKKFVIIDHPFTEEGGELTPTQKKKRRVIEAKYKDLIDSMYPPE